MIKFEACPWVDSEGGQRVGIPPTGESHMAIGFLKILAWSHSRIWSTCLSREVLARIRLNAD